MPTSASSSGIDLRREAGYGLAAACALPLGATRRGTGLVSRFARRRGAPPRNLPVVLLHGFAHNRSAMFRYQAGLVRRGYDVIQVGYPTVGHEVGDCVDYMNERLEGVVRKRGRVHAIGHSLGGILLRHAYLDPGIAPGLATCVTVATPHQGTQLGQLTWAHRVPVFGPMAASLAPGSSGLTALDRATLPGVTRWVCVYSPDDPYVPGDGARLAHPALDATCHQVDGLGHYGLAYSRRAWHIVRDAIDAADQREARGA